jgi:hypothetical protein
MVTSEVIKMSRKEIQQGARAAGLPFSGKNINPLLTSLTMLGFLEQEEEGNKKVFFKSPLIREPSTKIDWSELMEGTKKFVKETWPEVADEYISRYCTDVEVVNPFTKEEVKLGTRSQKSPPVVSSDKQDYGAWYEG